MKENHLISTEYLPPVHRLNWDINDDIAAQIDDARITLTNLTKSIHISSFELDYYGEKYISEVCQADPDSYIQLVLQLVWKRMYKQPCPMKESHVLEQNQGVVAHNPLNNASWTFADKFDDREMLVNYSSVCFILGYRKVRAF